jgi:predicted phage terminase large subunit-like protein
MKAGKTFAIILSLIKFAMMQNTTAVVFRRTSTQLRQNGGIWQEATSIFQQFFGKNVVIRSRDLEIYIPSTNATIKFSHLQHLTDVNSHLGAQYSCVIFDETTLFDFDLMVLPLLGRLRNARVDYKPQMFWATNPMYNHGVYHWIKDFYLDEHGIPLAEKSNVERYLVLQNNQPIWYNTRQEAEDIHGTDEDNGVLSFRSIRAHVTDNIPLLKANPAYISNLKALPEIKRRIFLDGSWTAREEEAGLFRRDWVKIIDKPNMRAKKRVCAWDFASTPVSSASPNPDWTRGVLISKDDLGVYTVEDVFSIRDRPHVVEELVYSTAQDNPTVTFSIPIDPGASGTAQAKAMQRKLGEKGVVCKLLRPTKSKRTRFLPFSAIAEAGYLQVVRADWNEEFFNELEEFTGLKPKERDDQADASSDAVYWLNQGLELPTSFILPDFTQATAFGFQSNEIPSDLVVKLT